MPEIQTSGPGQKLARRYGLKGVVFAPSVEPVIVPVVLMDDLTDADPALLFAAGAATQGGAAGAVTQSALANPTGSGVLLEHIQLHFASGDSGNFEVTMGGPALSATVTPEFLDRRIAGTPRGRVTSGTDAGATAEIIDTGTTLANTLVAANISRLVLAEGDRVHLLRSPLNSTMRFQWVWAERFLTAEEAF